MKIGFISTYFWPFEGGAERNCFFNAKELAKKHEVHVFTSDRKGKQVLTKKEEIISGIRVHRCREFFRFGYYFPFYPSMLSKVLETDLDILHIHSVGFLYHDLIVLFKKMLSPKTKLVNTPHGLFMVRRTNLLSKLLKSVIKFFENPINGLYSATILMTEQQRSWLDMVNLHHPIVIPAGLQRDFFKKVSTSDIIKKFSLKNKFVFSYVGRIQDYKGVQQFISGLENLIRDYPDIVFLIGGKDEGYLAELRSLVNAKKLRDYVIFLGELDEETKIKVLEASDVYVFPSEWEAFGISMLEAMARGNAIITTKTEGGLFLVRPYVNGLHYKFRDISALEKCARFMLENPKKVQKMQQTNRILAKNFLWEDLAKKLEKVYCDLLAR